MSKFDSEKVMPRYFAIAVVLTLLGVAIIGKAFYIMTAKKDYWTEVADQCDGEAKQRKHSQLRRTAHGKQYS